MTATAGVSEAVLAFTEHEHRDLARGIDRIHDAGCTVGERPTPETLRLVREVIQWFHRELEPHLGWEESWLYPRIEQLTGTPWATRAARYDHGQVRELVERVTGDEIRGLRSMTPVVAADLRCHLFSLEALLRAHIEREERLLQPVLVEGFPTSSSPVDGASDPRV